MEAVITALTTALTPTALWGVVTPMAGLIVAMVLFSLGLTFTRRGVKGAAKGKPRF